MNNYLKPYVADVGVALAFGVGCLLFKAFKKDNKDVKGIKENIKKSLSKWTTANTIQKFNALIINNTDKTIDAFKILKSISEAEVAPQIETYNCLFFMSFNLGQYEIATKLFEEITDFMSPVQPDIVTFNILIKGVVKEAIENQQDIALIETLSSKLEFYKNEISNRKLDYDDFTYNTLIDAHIECNEFSKAWEIFQQMSSYIKKPDIYTYTTIVKGLKTCKEPNSFSKIIEIYESIKLGNKENIKLDEFLINTVLDSCVRYEEHEMALKIFNEMPIFSVPQTVVSYSIMLKSFAVKGKLEESIELFNKMKLHGIRPNEITYDCLLNCSIKCERLDIMNNIYECMKNDNLTPNNNIYCTLIKGFNRTKNYNLAFKLYETMNSKDKKIIDIVFFNSLLDCSVEASEEKRMLEIFEFIKVNHNPSIITYSTLLKGYTKFNCEEKALELYKEMINSDSYLDEVFFNTMADFYAKKKDSVKAIKVLEDMKARNVSRSSIIYSILISLFSCVGKELEALEMYNNMIRENLKPTMITYTIIMQMYIKLKKMDDAIRVFYEMRENKITLDAVSFNFIINGCSFNKKLEKAIEILNQSFEDGIKLNDNTYSNVLEYIVNNKFMKLNERCLFAGNILHNLKERKIQVKGETYSKVMKMMYQLNGEPEQSKMVKTDKFQRFSNLKNEIKQDKCEYQQKSIYSNDNILSNKPVQEKKPQGGFNRSGNHQKVYNNFN